MFVSNNFSTLIDSYIENKSNTGNLISPTNKDEWRIIGTE